MNLESYLQKLGLNKNESRVYLALIKSGLTSVGPLIRHTKLHRMLVYQALERLVNLHLASMVYIKKKKHFQASNPDILFDHIREEEAVAHSVVPELIKLQRQAGEQKLEVKILYGHSGFTANLETLVKSAAKYDKKLRILGGAQADYFYEAIGEWYPRYLDLLKKYKVAKWQISPDVTSQAFKEKFARESHTVLKTLAVGLSSPTLTRITPEMVSIEIYTEEIVVIQIYNKVVAQGYCESFELLWKQATIYHV
ncbi:hypothetical protein HZA43_04170 [Candidatus Peregrinibacteria bacterium]|nr:hypothetical protein [Candidatus Peregrinibacteria bacterium]